MDSKSASALPTVCGRTPSGDPAYFPQADYRGRRIYFCTEFCLNAFQSDPDKFYQAHSRTPEACEACEFEDQRR